MLILNLSYASRKDKEEVTINVTKQFPLYLRDELAYLPKEREVTIYAKIRECDDIWPWAFRVNRTGESGAITSRYVSTRLVPPDIGRPTQIQVFRIRLEVAPDQLRTFTL